MLRRFGHSLAHLGLRHTSAAVWRRLLTKWQQHRFAKNVLAEADLENKFTWIYRNNYWSSSESVSGPGSTLRDTDRLRRQLPKLLADFSIQSIFDAPCGDFHWMRQLLSTIDLSYIGGDIVQPIIAELNSRHRDGRRSFIHLDLTRDPFPAADLMICRDCLFHLSFPDVYSLLRNFVASRIRYLLVTTHRNADGFTNIDIPTGGSRRIDLFAAPFNFPNDPLAILDDGIARESERLMCLWSRDQIAAALLNFDQTAA